MKKSFYSTSITAVLALASISVQAAGEDLVYVAVEPCRIVDTRNAVGPIAADTSRNFLAAGSAAQLLNQGGTADCLNPKGSTKPLAIVAYVLAVPPGPGSTAGVLTAFPAGQPDPAPGTGSTVNFAAGQVIGNTTTITLCDPGGACPGDFAILARTTNQQVVIDVQGYFFPGGGSGSCPADMVSAGSLCVDIYESSVTNAAGDVQYGGAGVDDYPCKDSGTGCGATEANPIFARSVANVAPSALITYYQAAQACANVGKRLPTTAEWQTAASGTLSGTLPVTGCNFTGAARLTGTGTDAACRSSVGAFDMIGNVWEWVAELQTNGATFTSTNNSIATSIGDGYDNQGDASIRALWNNGPQAFDARLGLRCVL